MPLAPSSQLPYPDSPHFIVNKVQFALAVMEAEVVVEATEHPCQVGLLVSPLPMHVPFAPFRHFVQKPPTAFRAGYPYKGEIPCPARPADVFEAEKLKGSRFPCRPAGLFPRETPKRQEARLLFGHLQPELLEPLPRLVLEPAGLRLILEAGYKVVRKADEMGLPSTLPSESPLEP